MNIKGYSLGNVSKVISTPLTGCLSTVVHGKVCQIPFQLFGERTRWETTLPITASQRLMSVKEQLVTGMWDMQGGRS